MYKIGLDIGIGSVGYSIIEVNSEANPTRIIGFGSRIFEVAENPKDGSSLAEPRRISRGARRRNRRHCHRIERIKSLIERNSIITKKELDVIYQSQSLTDIYEIRYFALSRKLDNLEFARLLVHLAQRRGFKSNRKTDAASDKELGSLLSAVEDNEKIMKENNFQTVGEMIYIHDKFKTYKRNKNEDYFNTISRGSLLDEVAVIFSCQRQQQNIYATEDFEKAYTDILSGQRSFEQGPASGPYSGNQIDKMIGKCTFEPNESRGVKASYTFEYFNLLQKINNINISKSSGKLALSDEGRKNIIKLAHEKAELTFKDIRKQLKITDDEIFSCLNYGNKKIEEVEKTKFNYLKNYHTMRKELDKISKSYILKISRDDRDEIARIFTVYKTDDTIFTELKNAGFNNEEIKALSNMTPFAKVGNLSIKAMKKIIPFLEEGMTYDKACLAADFDFKGHSGIEKSKYLPKLRDDNFEITSPVVKRAVNQTINVINAIIKKYGSPCDINIELAREVSKNRDERNKIEKDQKKNFETNEKMKASLEKEFGVKEPKYYDVLKRKLWEEQDGRCAYTGQALAIEKIFSTGYCEVDHIIPYSISFDDGYRNKVLVTSRANQEKGNRLPLEYIKESDKDRFIIWAKTYIKDHGKRERLLKESFTDEDKNSFREKNLHDTRHMSKFMLNHINDNLKFDENFTHKKRVTAVNGAVTAYIRKRWGINKFREDGDLHHAVDAVVIGCISDGVIQKVTSYMKYTENKYSMFHDENEVMDKHFPPPWVGFLKELEIRLGNNAREDLRINILPNYQDVDTEKINPPFVSRMRKEKVTGSAHKETIRGFIEEDGVQYAVSKTSLKNLKLDSSGEILNYYNKESDILLYNLLKERLHAFNGDGEKAFGNLMENPVYKPTPKGGTAPIVKKVKIIEKSTLNVSVNKGIAANGSMVRIDIFKVQGEGFYFVPIYISDLIKEVLPNKASVAAKTYENWKEMKEEDFLFTLYPNDLIKVTAKKELKMTVKNSDSLKPKNIFADELFLYYKFAGISVASLTVINHDNSYQMASLGIKSLANIEKYYVDILGNYYPAKKEKRKHNR